MKIQKSLADYGEGLKSGSEKFTTPLFWDCECELDYIQTKSLPKCDRCGAFQDDQPDSMIDEVLQAALEWKKHSNLSFVWRKDNGYETRPGNITEENDNMRSAV